VEMRQFIGLTHGVLCVLYLV